MPRIKDKDGHLWPITGCYCLQCRFPLMPVSGSKNHPTCEQEDEE